MRWEERLAALFDDLEQQAEGLYNAERDLEVADRSQAEYQQVTVASRLFASVGSPVALRVRGVGLVRGTLQRVADDWCLVASAAGDWVVRLDAIQSAQGVSPRSVNEAAWPVTARLGLGSVLRRIAQSRERCVVHLGDQTAYDVRLLRVGRDFVEAEQHTDYPEGRPVSRDGRVVLFAFAAVVAVYRPQ